MDSKADVMATDPMKHILTVIEKKLRNLDKRKVKLDGYRQTSMGGGTLDPDQQAAMNKYDEVIGSIKFAREIFQNFAAAETEITKAKRKSDRKEQSLKEEAKRDFSCFVIKAFNILKLFASEQSMQDDFRQGNNDATVLNEEEIQSFVDFYRSCIMPEISDDFSNVMEKLNSIGSHMHRLWEGNMEAVCGTSYHSLKECFDKITTCQYFHNMTSFKIEVPEDIPEPATEEENNEIISEISSGSLSPTPDFAQPTTTEQEEGRDETDSVPIPPEQLEPNFDEQTPEAPNTTVEAEQPNLTFTDTPVAPMAPPPQQTLQPAPAVVAKLSVEEVLADVTGQYDFFQESMIDQLAISNPPVINPPSQTNGILPDTVAAASLSYSQNPQVPVTINHLSNEQITLGMGHTTFGSPDDRAPEQVLPPFRPSPSSSAPLQDQLSFSSQQPNISAPEMTSEPASAPVAPAADKTPFANQLAPRESPTPNHIPLPGDKSSGYQSYNTGAGYHNNEPGQPPLGGSRAQPSPQNAGLDQNMAAGDADAPQHNEPAKQMISGDIGKIGKGSNHNSYGTNYVSAVPSAKQNSSTSNHYNQQRGYRPTNRNNYGNFDSLGHPKYPPMHNGSYGGMPYNVPPYGQPGMFGPRRNDFGGANRMRGHPSRGPMKTGPAAYNRSRTFRPQNPE